MTSNNKKHTIELSRPLDINVPDDRAFLLSIIHKLIPNDDVVLVFDNRRFWSKTPDLITTASSERTMDMLYHAVTRTLRETVKNEQKERLESPDIDTVSG